MAKTFRTSSEALCILTRMTLITIKTQEAVQNTLLGKKTEAIHLFDSEVQLKNWPHPADVVKITN